jgi:prepilin-type processing-associated H-X9-DG protein
MVQIAEPASTLLFIESTWSHTESGEPVGGGNWLVIPPCRYYENSHLDSFTGRIEANVPVFTTAYGWNVQSKSSETDFKADQTLGQSSPEQYGNAWPRHDDHLNVALIDGSVRSVSVKDLGQGCNVKDSWLGKIYDRKQYLWDVN